jgi:hypothetical protein
MYLAPRLTAAVVHCTNNPETQRPAASTPIHLPRLLDFGASQDSQSTMHRSSKSAVSDLTGLDTNLAQAEVSSR